MQALGHRLVISMMRFAIGCGLDPGRLAGAVDQQGLVLKPFPDNSNYDNYCSPARVIIHASHVSLKLSQGLEFVLQNRT